MAQQEDISAQFGLYKTILKDIKEAIESHILPCELVDYNCESNKCKDCTNKQLCSSIVKVFKQIEGTEGNEMKECQHDFGGVDGGKPGERNH